MRFIYSLLIASSLMAPALSFADVEPAAEQPILLTNIPSKVDDQQIVISIPPSNTDSQPAPKRTANIDLILDRAMSLNLIAGGVVVIGNHDGILATAARGVLNDAAGAPRIDEHTLFDVASLTKVIATTPAVMKLADQGLVNLSDPVSRYLPEFAGRDDITVFHLLTHTSGLEEVSIAAGQPIQNVLRRAAAERNRTRPGSHFHYADINFIILGELVHRVSGQTLDNFCQQEIYGPLGAQETMFLPPRSLSGVIAPTSGYAGGVVQDSNARHLGGVAGHAGLFSSAYDLSRFARMLLGNGSTEQGRLFSEDTFSRMTTPYYCNNGQVKRGLGWDMDSPFSAPKGNFFSAASFGHTGYSGSSIWVDPQQDLFVIMLTRRLNYSDTRSFNQLRRTVSTIAAADFKVPGEDGALAPVWDAAMNAQVIEAALPPLKEAKVVKVASHRKRTHQQRVQRRSARVERVVAKHKAGRSKIRLAKAETGRSLHKKKRTLAKS